MEWRYLQEVEKQTNPKQALQPFLSLFLPLLPSGLPPIPRWPQLLQAWWQKPQQVFAWLGAKRGCSLGGHQHCSHPALLLREGKQSSMGHGWELGPPLECESQDTWVPLPPGVPQGHSTLTVSSCPCSAGTWEGAGTGTESFCQGRAVSLPWSLCWMSQHSPRRSLLLCTSLVPLAEPVPKSCPNPRSHSSILP